MTKEFHQSVWDSDVEDDCRQLARLGVREDLSRAHDWTTVALVAAETPGRAAVVARRPGVISGLRAAELTLSEMDANVQWSPQAADGDVVGAGQVVANIAGPARSLLTAERLLLNFIGHLSGVATLTRAYVDAIAGTRAKIYDTRKTTPGWRRLEKYAVRCGGGQNHRTGLFDAVLIKDNHLALGGSADADQTPAAKFTPAEAVRKARAFVRNLNGAGAAADMIVEVEVDTLEQLEEVLRVRPDMVLLDNMGPEKLRAAVARRDAVDPAIQLEASGGISLETVRAVAESGVDRISSGALTHSAVWFDVALDWQ